MSRNLSLLKRTEHLLRGHFEKGKTLSRNYDMCCFPFKATKRFKSVKATSNSSVGNK